METVRIEKTNDPRFFNVYEDKCIRTINLPFNVVHPNVDKELLIHKNNTKFKQFHFYKNLDKSFLLLLASFGLEVAVCRFFIKPSLFQAAFHTDYPNFNDQTVGLNFAISENSNSDFFWYRLKEGRDRVRVVYNGVKEGDNPKGTQFFHFFKEDCEIAYHKNFSEEKNTCYMVNTGYIHRVQNLSPNCRYSFSYFVKEKGKDRVLQWDRAVDLLSPIIA